MRKCRQYSKEFKEKLLAKVFSPNAPSAIELARKAGIPYGTLVTWIRMSKNTPIESNNAVPGHSEDKSAEAKLRAVCDTLKMTVEEKSAYCRQEGLYAHQLDEWKTQMLFGVSAPKAGKSENRQYVSEIKQLKKELNRTERALAETSALLVLKKSELNLGGQRGRLIAPENKAAGRST